MPALATAFIDATDRTPLSGRTVTAQAFSWGGDVALLATGERSFLTGVASFFGAHVAYVAAFSSLRGPHSDVRALRLPLGLWLSTAPVMSLAAGRKDPPLRAPFAAYATILSAMFAGSRLLDPSLPRPARRAVQAGTALFVVSDTALATQAFLLREPRPALGGPNGTRGWALRTRRDGAGEQPGGARCGVLTRSTPCPPIEDICPS